MKQNKKYVIITGQIASGKSTLASIVAEKFPEFLVLDADAQVNELYRRGAKLYDVIVKTFGTSVLNEKGNISKSKLREVVFFNEKNRKKLNDLTHGVILENMVNIAKNSDSKVIFMQIPLLNEAIGKLKKLIKIDEVWNVTANEDVRFNRLMSRKGMTEEVARRVMEIQSEFKNDNYDVIDIENNGSLYDLKKILPELVANSCIDKIVKSMGITFDNNDISDMESKENESLEFIDKKVINKELETIENANYFEPQEDPTIDTLEEIASVESVKNMSNNDKDIFDLDEFLKDSEGVNNVNVKEEDFLDFIYENSSNENSLTSKDNTSKEKESIIENVEKYFNMGDTIKIDTVDESKSEDLSFLEYDKQKEEIKLNRVKEVSDFFEKEQDMPIEEENLKKVNNKKKKKKRGFGKKLLIGLVSILMILTILFFGSIAYGGKNYSLNYIEEIDKYSKEYGVDPKVVLAIMRVESNFDSKAESKANAKGLMQILPDTAKHISKLLKVDVNSVDLNDSDTNIKFGTYYIKYLMQNFKNLDTVYAAYNGGIGNVNTWLKDEKYSNDGITLYNIPSPETKHYVYKVNKALNAYEILYGKEFPTKKEKGIKKFLQNTKNVIKYIFSSF